MELRFHMTLGKKPKCKTEKYCHKLNKDFKHGPHEKILKKKKNTLSSLEDMGLKTP